MSVDLPSPNVLARLLINHKRSSYLWFDQDQVDEDHDKVIFDVFVGEALAARALRQSHAFALGSVIGTTIRAIQVRDRIGAFDADGHRVMPEGS